MSDYVKPTSSKPIKKKGLSDTMHRTVDHIDTSKRDVDITAMIRSLQRTEGLADCFRRGLADCDQLECAWRQYCLEKPDSSRYPE